MTFTRLHITVALGLVTAVWAAMLWSQDVYIGLEHFGPFSSVIGVLVVFSLLLEHVLWHQIWMQGWFFDRPDLRGTWKVTIQSDWRDESGQPISPIICYMGITQTLSKLNMHLMTAESESWFVAHGIVPTPGDEGYCIAAVYMNKPQLKLRNEKSDMHYGALKLETHGPSKGFPVTLEAEYWTDRRTTGTMDFENRTKKLFTRFKDAQSELG